MMEIPINMMGFVRPWFYSWSTKLLALKTSLKEEFMARDPNSWRPHWDELFDRASLFEALMRSEIHESHVRVRLQALENVINDAIASRSPRAHVTSVTFVSNHEVVIKFNNLEVLHYNDMDFSTRVRRECFKRVTQKDAEDTLKLYPEKKP